MRKVTMFDTKPYDRIWFEKIPSDYEFIFLESKLNAKTALLAKDSEAVCAFVNDDINSDTITALKNVGVKIIALRCAGYSNVDIKAAYKNLYVVRVPAYSPYAVAEFAMSLLLTLNRKTHKAYIRTRDFNFSLVGLTGMDLHGKTAGVIGTGKIGRCFINICKGFGMRVVAYDLYPAKDSDIEYVDLDTLLSESDIISLHCPLTDKTKHIINKSAFEKMKDGVFIINTSRGALIDSEALLEALNSGKVQGAGLDVYEEEANFFYMDLSEKGISDNTLSLLVSKPNVILTSHQAFLTKEALENIAKTTIQNLDEFFAGSQLTNEVGYQCDVGKIVEGHPTGTKRCF